MALPHSLDPLDYPARFQFGQHFAPCGGASCCTDTCLQMLAEYWKEKTYSLSAIRAIAQKGVYYNEGACTGINHVEVLNALNRLGIYWYKVAFGVDANFLASKLAYGPVMVGVEGHTYPNDRTRCGTPKAEHGGRTQCNFHGAHMILALRYQKHLDDNNKKLLHYDFVTRDPNHNSPSRPEDPTFDRITKIQMQKSMLDLPRYTRFTSTYIIYPTRKKNLKNV